MGPDCSQSSGTSESKRAGATGDEFLEVMGLDSESSRHSGSQLTGLSCTQTGLL